jgi:hypothetical protein
VSAESRVPLRVRPQAGDGLCFALESLAQLEAICEMRWQNFYGDDAIKACVAGLYKPLPYRRNLWRLKFRMVRVWYLRGVAWGLKRLSLLDHGPIR